ncbi:hypothetical protein OIO90_005385 [Microbotryomycetes sp. JL221]|nr:hypothetical protein OIO90_005385 [Microbotryomycetes sp. JL221]
MSALADEPTRPTLGDEALDDQAAQDSALLGADSATRRASTSTSLATGRGSHSRPWTPTPSRRKGRSRILIRKIEDWLHLSKRRRSTAARGPQTPRSDRSVPFFDDDEQEQDSMGSTLIRPNIRLRLVTANMHDSLPNGDLSDFLGELRPSEFRKRHPSVSSRTSQRSTAGEGSDTSRRRTPTNARFGERGSDDLPLLPHNARHPYHVVVVAGQECPTASGVLAGKVRALDGRGWTSILEDWLCGPTTDEQGTDLDQDAAELRPPQERDQASIIDENRRGPYVLVEKLRLMGIYLGVFVLTECQHLVKGVSAGRVTSGLIGGRVGNKGGVAISLSFAGSRLLFISAHLAAHAHAVDLRKANVKKIFDEMVVDDFLGQGARAGNLTNRFEQTFFMGDLNFRLNITRQHADWLVKTKDYNNGLEFDQLRQILADPEGCFKGFSEAPITFAPTYKYDVATKVRKKRSALLRADKPVKRPAREWVSYEPADVDPGSISDPEVLQATRDKDPEDALSLVSDKDSVASGLSDYDKIERDEIPMPAGTPSSPPKGNPTVVDALRKSSHVRFMSLVRNNSAAAQVLSKSRAGADESGGRRIQTLSIHDLPPTKFIRPVLRSAHSDVIVPLARTSIGDTSSGGSSADQSEDEDQFARIASANGVTQVLEPTTDGSEPKFDSSPKQRVQSWTDRILFKSIVPVPEEDEFENGIDPYFRRPSNIADTIRELLSGLSSSATTTLHKSKSLAVERALAEKATVKLQRWQSEAASRRSSKTVHSSSRANSPFSDLFKRQPRSALSREQSPEPASTSQGVQRSKSMRERVKRNPSLTGSVKTSRSHDRLNHLRGQRRVSADELNFHRAKSDEAKDKSNEAIGKSSLKFAHGELRNGTTVGQSRKPKRPSFQLRSSSSSRSISGDNPLHLATVPSAPLPARTGASDDDSARPLTLPRSSTRASARSASAATSPAPVDVGIGRIKSFFHLPSLSFFQTRHDGDEQVVSTPTPAHSPVATGPLIVGPRKGQIDILEYNAVSDLVKMGATSDHRPVYAVATIGIGGQPVPLRS